MSDPVAATMLALSSRSPAAIGSVFMAGLVTSIGPCIAPRYIALAAIVNGDRRPTVATIVFVSGLISAFAALGYGTGILGTLWSLSVPIYTTLALGLIGGGCVALVRAVPAADALHACSQHAPAPGRRRSLGAIFLLGASGAFVISPCCTPIVATVVAWSTAIGQPLTGVVLLLSFAFGHTLPLFFAGNAAALIRKTFRVQISGQAVAIVSAVLMLALGLYYAVLA